jgi:hypothetical protein
VSREEIVFDSADRPSTALRTSGEVFWNASEIDWRLLPSWSVSSCPSVLPSSLNACVTSYGEVVRLTGMRREGLCFAVPSGSTARYFSPSSVLIMIEAREALPTQVSLTRNVTFTCPRSRDTPVTLPTFTPATRTSFPEFSPADSVKSALYVVPPPTTGRSSAAYAAEPSPSRITRPTTATATGLRSRIGFTTCTSTR